MDLSTQPLREAPSDEEDVDDGEDLSLQYRVTAESRFRQQLLERMHAEAKQRRSSSDIGAGEEEEKGEEDGSEGAESPQVAEDLPSLFRGIPAPYSHPEDFQRVIITSDGEKPDPERAEVCRLLLSAIAMREKHVFRKPDKYWGSIDEAEFDRKCEETALQATGTLPLIRRKRSTSASSEAPLPKLRRRPDPPFDPFNPPMPGRLDHEARVVNGVVMVFPKKEDGAVSDTPLYQPPSVDEFYDDYHELVRIIHHGPTKSATYRRLRLLEARFHLHTLLNQDKEVESQKSVPHRDFYNVRKVDTHVHHSACMNQKHLLRFIKNKLRHHGSDVVIFRDGRFLTLAEVFKSLSLTAYDLSVDTLDMHAGHDTFHRFDRFNLKYNPCGQSRLREIFIKTDNMVAGRYLAEITKEVFSDLEAVKYSMAEYRVSVYGRKRTEWDKLGRWYFVNRLASFNVRWMVQIPRLYAVYKMTGQVETFQDMLDNIFLPLFEVTLDPASNPPLHCFLASLVGFDCVDDESKAETFRHRSLPVPADWDLPYDPPFSYWLYYLNANLLTLNRLRQSRGMSTFSFRPHAGEAGDLNHLAAAFLVSEHVNHGITMRKSPPLQYLYYLAQVGLAMSPLSNNRLFVDYNRNPFYTYFARGLNVSLSTDDPLLLHFTKEPLVEEYCVATQVWKLSSTDMCEVARNSVLQSGFEHPYKAHFLGKHYYKPGVQGNDISHTNVPNIRVQFRWEMLREERNFVRLGAQSEVPRLVTFASTDEAEDAAQRARNAAHADAYAAAAWRNPSLRSAGEGRWTYVAPGSRRTGLDEALAHAAAAAAAASAGESGDAGAGGERPSAALMGRLELRDTWGSSDPMDCTPAPTKGGRPAAGATGEGAGAGAGAGGAAGSGSPVVGSVHARALLGGGSGMTHVPSRDRIREALTGLGTPAEEETPRDTPPAAAAAGAGSLDASGAAVGLPMGGTSAEGSDGADAARARAAPTRVPSHPSTWGAEDL